MEFMLRPGETAAEMEHPAMIATLVAPYVDPAHLDITRAVVYKFHNVAAERWQAGRVFFAGDAAHQMPPMMGQGLVSGLRDAANLTWKLALVLRDAADPDILASYETERRPHAKEMADISARVAALFCTRRRSLALMRDRFFRTIQRIPRVRRFIQHLEFKPAAVFAHGLIAGGRRRSGKAAEGFLFPQITVITSDGTAARLDDLLGSGFTIVGMHADPRLVVAQGDEVWTRLGTRLVQIVPAGQSKPPAVPGVCHVTDTTGKLAAWFGRHGAQLAVVRPDRYVFAAVPAVEAEHLAHVVTEAFPRPTTDDRPRTTRNEQAQGQPRRKNRLPMFRQA
jgi:3-(3-hydroxy-phenyl)propionate hydroxylase